MNNPLQVKESISLINNEDQLVQLTEKYPWCNAAQFYLLHHYKKNNSPQFQKQAEKTAMFFTDTNWLNWQLHLLSAETIPEEKIDEEIPENIENFSENIQPKAFEEKATASLEKTDEDVIAFEPLHMVDYFASQGIKISAEITPNDKLGNQMKSFTEWLKSMKKIHKENLPAADEQTDKNIQRIAETSNIDADVATEAMANVLINQNKKEKAIEVYEKLSLLNPAKSGYFAAKINSLKTS